jgi:hypothetical protein
VSYKEARGNSLVQSGLGNTQPLAKRTFHGLAKLPQGMAQAWQKIRG